MANSLYDAGRDRFARGEIDWVSDDIRGILIDSTEYTEDVAAHEFLSSIPAGARVSVAALTGKSTLGNGVCDADDTVFEAVSGPQVEAIVLYVHTGTDGTSPLVAFMDTGTNLPVAPNGGDITVEWSDGANRIFKL